MDCTYVVTVKDVGNITDKAENIHTIITSTDNIQPRDRVHVVPVKPGVSVEAARYNPTFTDDLENLIRETVRRVEESEQVIIIAVRPVQSYRTERQWNWDGFILVENDGSTREYDLTGMCNRASSAYEVPR